MNCISQTGCFISASAISIFTKWDEFSNAATLELFCPLLTLECNLNFSHLAGLIYWANLTHKKHPPPPPHHHHHLPPHHHHHRETQEVDVLCLIQCSSPFIQPDFLEAGYKLILQVTNTHVLASSLLLAWHVVWLKIYMGHKWPYTNHRLDNNHCCHSYFHDRHCCHLLLIMIIMIQAQW